MTRLERIAALTADRWADARGDRAAGWPARSFAAIAENEMAALACRTPELLGVGRRAVEAARAAGLLPKRPDSDTLTAAKPQAREKSRHPA